VDIKPHFHLFVNIKTKKKIFIIFNSEDCRRDCAKGPFLTKVKKQS